MISRDMKRKNRQDLPTSSSGAAGDSGQLWVVATPLGNLEDGSPRMKRILSEVDWILCEDTRRTSQLLSALGISGKRLERFDAHSDTRKVDELIGELTRGRVMALVTDAGTPAISDPGALLVRGARLAAIQVLPVPGPSAPIALLSVAGFHQTAFVFRGFFPRKNAEKRAELKLVSESHQSGLASVYVWFESPERMIDSLEVLKQELPQVDAIASKEISKLYEKSFWGKAVEVFDQVESEIQKEGSKGEWCFAIDLGAVTRGEVSQESCGDWEKALKCVLSGSESPSQAAKIVSQEFGVPKNRVYERALQIKGKKEQ